MAKDLVKKGKLKTAFFPKAKGEAATHKTATNLGKSPTVANDKWNKANKPELGKSQVESLLGIGAGATAVAGAPLVAEGIQKFMSPRTIKVQGNEESLFVPQILIEKASPKLIPLPKSTPHNTIAGYNLGGYATSSDALSFIKNTYEVTPDVSTPESAQMEIDRIIQKAGKPTEITGNMIASSAKRYGVDPKMLLVLIRKETSLGTNLKTKNNPGNILNTDEGGKKEYPTMQEGVNAVARELQRRNLSIK